MLHRIYLGILLNDRPQHKSLPEGTRFKLKSKIATFCSLSILWLYLINSVLKVVVNSSILNIGPVNNKINITSFKFRETHPTNPTDPKKYRTYGGGVLIAIRRDLDNNSTPCDIQCAAAILGILLKFSDGKNDSFQFLQS